MYSELVVSCQLKVESEVTNCKLQIKNCKLQVELKIESMFFAGHGFDRAVDRESKVRRSTCGQVKT